MIAPVTDPEKMVTDPTLIPVLDKLGLDRNYVEFWHDYAPRSQGQEYSPVAKFYRDLRTPLRFAVVSNMPMVKPTGEKIVVGWERENSDFLLKPNLFSARTYGQQINMELLADQPTGERIGDKLSYEPEIRIGGNKIMGTPVPTLLLIDPLNENYAKNTLLWRYNNIVERRIRTFEGRYRDRFYVLSDPGAPVSIKHNFVGDFQLKLGRAKDADGRMLKVNVVGDEEIIEASEFVNAAFPVEIGASGTFYPDTNGAGVDGDVVHYEYTANSWHTVCTKPGNLADYIGTDIYFIYVISFTTTNTWCQCQRAILVIDTSDLPDICTKTAASLFLYYRSKGDALGITPDIGIVSSNPLNDTSIVAGDYDSLGTTLYAPVMSYANYAGPGYEEFAFNATGLAAIPVDDKTRLGIRNYSYDILDELQPGLHDPAWIYYLDTAMSCWSTEKGAGYKPKLVVTYTMPWTPNANMGDKLVKASFI